MRVQYVIERQENFVILQQNAQNVSLATFRLATFRRKNAISEPLPVIYDQK